MVGSNINIRYALDLIKEFEGFKKDVYLCPANKCTIGYGYAIRHPETGRILSGPDEMDAARQQFPNGVTESEANEMLDTYVRAMASRVTCLIKAHLTDKQFCAILDFCYNLGEGAFESSTLRRRINEGKFEDVPAQLRRWNKANGKVMSGLARRREAEIALWLSDEKGSAPSEAVEV